MCGGERGLDGGRGDKKQQLFIYLQAVGWCLALGSPLGEGYNVIDGQEEGKKKYDSLKNHSSKSDVYSWAEMNEARTRAQGWIYTGFPDPGFTSTWRKLYTWFIPEFCFLITPSYLHLDIYSFWHILWQFEIWHKYYHRTLLWGLALINPNITMQMWPTRKKVSCWSRNSCCNVLLIQRLASSPVEDRLHCLEWFLFAELSFDSRPNACMTHYMFAEVWAAACLWCAN